MSGLFGVAESSITSNARVKRYPAAVVLQVANDNIFRDAGFEPRTRLYSVSAKGKAENPERSLQSSRSRAKAAVRDIALCNHFAYFFTWTLSKDRIDRYDVNLISRKVQTFLKNAVQRKGFQYVLVPEYHKDGAIHFHGLCNLGDIRIERATDARTKLPLRPRWLNTQSPVCRSSEAAEQKNPPGEKTRAGSCFARWTGRRQGLRQR